MPDPTAKEAAHTKEQRPARGLKILIALLVSIILPAALYAIYVFGQLEHIRQHNLRGLESTAQAVAELLDNTRRTVGNLRKDPGYACMFFQRQNRAGLITPTCDALAGAGDSGIDPEQLQFDVSRETVDIIGKLKSGVPLRVEVKVGTVLEQVPFGADFDRLMIVNEQGRLLGSAISPQRSSPMLPPGVAAFGRSSPVRALDLAKLKFVGSTKDAPITFAGFGRSTFVHPVVLGGTRYTLMCQPWLRHQRRRPRGYGSSDVAVVWTHRRPAYFSAGARRGSAVHHPAFGAFYTGRHQLADSQGPEHRTARAHPLRRHFPHAARDARTGDGALGWSCRPRHVCATA